MFINTLKHINLLNNAPDVFILFLGHSGVLGRRPHPEQGEEQREGPDRGPERGYPRRDPEGKPGTVRGPRDYQGQWT